MEFLSNELGFKELKSNMVIGPHPKLVNSKINFTGENNIIFFENEASIINSTILFNGSNSILYISSTNKKLFLNISLNNNNCFFIGKNNYFNGILNASCSEEKHIFIGCNGLFSFGIWLRTADPHLIYSADSMKRINPSKSIYIGDSVWIGQGSLILKGTQIHSGSIIGAGSVVSNKIIPSNCSVGGNPCRTISKNVFWRSNSVHLYTAAETRLVEICDNTETLFFYEQSVYAPFDEIDNVFSEKISSLEKIEKIKAYILIHNQKNRFAFGRNR